MSLDIPFWAYSPSPFTIAFWLVLYFWGLLHLPHEAYADAKRFPKLVRIFNGLLIVGLPVLLFDTFWAVLQGFKFIYLYPEDLMQIASIIVRNMCFLFMCVLFTAPLFTKKILRVKFSTMIFTVIMLIYMVIWFSLAPDMSFTDWTYALRMGYSGKRVVEAFSISHIGGKFFQGLVFISLWNRGK